MIPIIGKGHTYLTGTPSESDLNTICSSVSRLATSPEEIAHVVDKNTSVTNITTVKMSKNRQALNKVIGSLANLDLKLGNIIQALEKGVSHWTICTIIFTVKILLYRP